MGPKEVSTAIVLLNGHLLLSKFVIICSYTHRLLSPSSLIGKPFAVNGNQ